VKILVLGGGVIGVTAAYYLSRDGHDVTVIDRNAQAASETSHANAGLLTPGDAYAWASPEALKVFIQSLSRRDTGIRVRPTVDPAFWRWSLAFLRQCTRAKTRVNTLRKLRLLFYSRDCINALAEDTGIDYDAEKRGVLYFYRSRASLEHGVRHMRLLAEHGLDMRVVDRDGVVGIDPGLAAAKDRIAGAIHSPMDQTGDCCKFTRSLAAWSSEHSGVGFAYETKITAMEASGGRIRRVMTDRGAFEADAFVLAMGSDSPFVARQVGVHLPIYPVKGYSITVPVRDGGAAPQLGGVDEDKLVAYSRLGNRLRVAATAEFCGHDRSHRPRDFEMLFKTAKELFPGAADYDRAEYWAGLRPMTPSSVPILGRARFDNLFLDVGHGHVGWSMACGSGKLVSDLVAARAPEIDTDGLLYAG
jgi:D-amino-acid dehydrogenase